MNREIKFRAWSEKDKCWIGDGPYDVLALSLDGDIFRCHSDSCESTIKEIYGEVVLQQFTGLTDKLGKDIYEGDIIVIDDLYPYFDEGKRNYVAVVEWCFAGFHYVKYCVNPDKVGVSDGINEPLEEGDQFSIIGNIYQNPELLK